MIFIWCREFKPLYHINAGKDVSDAENPVLRRQSWSVIEDHYRRGVFKAIGVSNYEVRHLKVSMSELLMLFNFFYELFKFVTEGAPACVSN